MMRILVLLGTGVLLAGLGAGPTAAPPPAPPRPPDPMTHALAKLHEPFDFHGIRDQRTTLEQALVGLAARTGVRFTCNQRAFKGEQVPEVETSPVAEVPLPKMRQATLSQVLGAILQRLPAPAAFMVRPGGVIEITTHPEARFEILGDSDRELPDLANLQFDGCSAEEALRALSLVGKGCSVVVDPRGGPRARVPITARFTNTPVDTAIRVVAEMADLKAVRADNLLFVTTREHAAILRQELQEGPLSLPLRDRPQDLLWGPAGQSPRPGAR